MWIGAYLSILDNNGRCCSYNIKIKRKSIKITLDNTWLLGDNYCGCRIHRLLDIVLGWRWWIRKICSLISLCLHRRWNRSCVNRWVKVLSLLFRIYRNFRYFNELEIDKKIIYDKRKIFLPIEKMFNFFYALAVEGFGANWIYKWG